MKKIAAYVDGRPDMIETDRLDTLISKDRVKIFLRAEGWAIVGRDRLRGAGGTYAGHERRLLDDKDCVGVEIGGCERK